MKNASLQVHDIARVKIEEPEEYDTPGLVGKYQRIKLYNRDGIEILSLSMHHKDGAIMPPAFDAEEF